MHFLIKDPEENSEVTSIKRKLCWDHSELFPSHIKGNWIKWRENKFNVIKVIDIYCYKGLADIMIRHEFDARFGK